MYGVDAKQIVLIALPFEERPERRPLINHRPEARNKVNAKYTADNIGIDFMYSEPQLLNGCLNNIRPFKILLAGSGLLPDDVVNNHDIINAHPGYLPNCKGLDAFKWAIYNGQPIGVTTHIIDRGIDEGTLIDRQHVPLYYEDTIDSLARRVYETEIDMLVKAIDLQPVEESIKNCDYPPRRRMPLHKELITLDRFEAIRKKSPSKYD